MEKINHKLIALLSCTLAFASTAQAETLDDVFVKVLASNPTVLSSYKNVSIAEEGITQAKGDFYPTLSAIGSITDSSSDYKNQSETHNTPKMAGVTFSQPLFAGGRIYSGFQVAQNTYFSAKATHESTVQKTLNSLVKAYIGVLTAKDVLSLQENQVKLLQQQMKMTNARFKQGEITKTDVMQATARLALANADSLQAAGDYRTAQTILETLVGHKVQNLSWPTINFDLPLKYTEELKETTLNTHPNVAASLALLNSKKQAITTAKSAHYPQFNAVASYTNNTDTSSGDYENKQIGVEFTMPLFQGGKTLSRVRSSIAAKEQAYQNYEQVKRDVTANLVDATQLYSTSLATLEAFKENEQAAKRAEEGVEKEQMAGERTVLDLLDARQELLQARVNVTRSKGSVVAQAYNLLSAMGTLNSIIAK
tara:strand:+ start:1266 stop:2537 length:1272 start_codon:yes stop_codon:yes gene_type:complete